MKIYRALFILMFLPVHLWAEKADIHTPCDYSITFSIIDVECNGDSTGAIVTNVAGTGIYTYRWSNESTDKNINNLPAETYFVTVTDELGCKTTEFATVTEPEELEVSFKLSDALCLGTATGAVDLTVNGGFGDYQYNWSDGGVNQDLVNIIAGTYGVRVTDENNCTIEDTVIINEPLELTSQSAVINVTCNAGSDGEIETFVFGGVGPYLYSWSTGAITKEVFDLPAGIYTRTITDDNECELTEQIEITEPFAFVSSFVVEPVTCNNQLDGEIDLTINGGTEPYTFLWSNSLLVLGEDTEDLTGLEKESYKVQVTDKNGCIHIDSTVVTEPQVLVTNINFKSVTCFEGSDGEAYFSVSGGSEPYSYKWSNDETTSDVFNLIAGDYFVVVADSNGCTERAEITVTEGDEIVIDYSVSIVSCKDDNDGAIDIEVTGGRGDYNYSWSNGSSSQDINSLPGDTYTITVSDDSSCIKEASIPVAVNPIICIEIPTAFSPNSDDINDLWIITNSELYPELSLEIFNRWGTRVFDAQSGYDDENLWDGTFHGQELPSDTYYYILKTNNGDEPFTGGISIIR